MTVLEEHEENSSGKIVKSWHDLNFMAKIFIGAAMEIASWQIQRGYRDEIAIHPKGLEDLLFHFLSLLAVQYPAYFFPSNVQHWKHVFVCRNK